MSQVTIKNIFVNFVINLTLGYILFFGFVYFQYFLYIYIFKLVLKIFDFLRVNYCIEGKLNNFKTIKLQIKL